jgi:hypothetical protein
MELCDIYSYIVCISKINNEKFEISFPKTNIEPSINEYCHYKTMKEIKMLAKEIAKYDLFTLRSNSKEIPKQDIVDSSDIHNKNVFFSIFVVVPKEIKDISLYF